MTKTSGMGELTGKVKLTVKNEPEKKDESPKKKDVLETKKNDDPERGVVKEEYQQRQR